MRAGLQQQIAPPTVKNTMDVSAAPTAGAVAKAVDSNAGPKVDFRSLIGNSNSDISRERAAKKAGDFSGAKTEDEFFKMLGDRANPTTPPKNKLDKDDFLKLFVAQMKYQNPLNPDDSAQMAAQLAQFNGLEQMLNVNKTLEEMKKVQETNRSVSMLDYIGKEVSMDGGKLRLQNGSISDVNFNIANPVAEAMLEVRDGAGAVVAKKGLGALNSGDHPLEWDGKGVDGKSINDGVYSFAVIGKGMDGADVAVDLKTKVKITGVDLKDVGGSFYTDVGKVKINEVSSVGTPGFVKAAAKKPGADNTTGTNGAETNANADQGKPGQTNTRPDSPPTASAIPAVSDTATGVDRPTDKISSPGSEQPAVPVVTMAGNEPQNAQSTLNTPQDMWPSAKNQVVQR